MKKILALILLLGMLIGMLPISATSSSIDMNVVPNQCVISTELLEMFKKTPDDVFPVVIWIEEIDTNQLESEIFDAIGNNRDTIRNDFNGGKSHLVSFNTVNQYVTLERSLYSYYQFQRNENFVDSIMSFVKSVIYVCKYAPTVFVEARRNDLLHIAKDPMVCSIQWAPKAEFEPAGDISLPLIRADYVRDTLLYTGSGISVGIIDEGNIDTTYGYFNSSNIVHYDSSYNVSNHTTCVASIIASTGNSNYTIPYVGIAPSVSVFCKPLDWLYGDIEWLLDQGVHVINFSGGINLPNDYNGQYSFLDQWVDHVAINHSVHLVVAAGNSGLGNGFVAHPGLAYNVITVGAIDDQNTVSQTDDVIAGFSSYQEGAYVTNKPDICAPGVLISTSYYPSGYFYNYVPAGAVTGTSFSAPHVTGAIAQMLDACPALIVLQDAVKAIIAASVYDEYLQFQSSDTAFEQYGAGLIDSRASVYTARHGCYASSYFSANCNVNSYQTFQFTVSSSDTMKRIALAWLVNSKLTGTHEYNFPTVGSMPDLDIEIYDPNGLKVEWCEDPNNNLDVIQLDNPSSGTYTAKVICKTPSNKKTYFTISWY